MSANKYSLGIRSKLIIIFIFIKVLPLLALAWFAWNQIGILVDKIHSSYETVSIESQDMGKQIVQLASKDSIQALDEKAQETIERLTSDTAQDVARFLYERDHDIEQAASTTPSELDYLTFLSSRVGSIVKHGTFTMNVTGEFWQNQQNQHTPTKVIEAHNKNNAKDFHYHSPATGGNVVEIPLYLEMTFIDLDGQEQVKITTSDILKPELYDVSNKENTYCKAETYFASLKDLKPGDIYVSDVIGAYQKTQFIGTYSKARAQKAGVDFTPQDSAYAGKENPLGKRFQAIVRWATPVMSNQKIIGFVTLALNHDHLMEFTDHVIPTEARYSEISDASTGNYTFMWDYLGRNISHPRDYFITGFDPETGQPALPWLEAAHYKKWQTENLNTTDFLETLPLYENQSLDKKPALEQIGSGYVGLDCRYLNFAPQCDGWMNLTEHGGSGSFLIFWSGLWKLTTAASIPYYTGKYGNSERGFGFVTIGANVDEFHKAAVATSEKIEKIGADHLKNLSAQFQENGDFLKNSSKETTRQLILSTLVMIVFIIIIAIWMASILTKRITNIIKNISLFQNGNLNQRIKIISGDELSELAQAFNSMADKIQQSMTKIRSAHKKSEITNRKLVEEVATRKSAEKKLAEHSDTLEHMVTVRTHELEQEIIERKQALDDLKQTQLQLLQSEKLAGIGQLAAGIAHEINTPIQYIGDNVRFFHESFSDIDNHLTHCDQLLHHTEDGKLASCLDKIDQSKIDLDMEFLREEVPQAIEQTLNGVAHVSQIVSSMKSFSHPGTKEKIQTNINEAIDNTITVSRNEWKYVAELEKDFDPNLPTVQCFPGELNQVFLNIIMNAAQAVEARLKSDQKARGVIRIQTRKIENEVEISIFDSGPGIPEEIRNKIFDPFFTTKEVGKGTGQGLAISWSVIVDKHGGKIWFETHETGTTFFIRLPIFDKLT